MSSNRGIAMSNCTGFLSTLFHCPIGTELELLKVVLDKLLFALLLLAAGGIGKLVFDTYQRKQEYAQGRAQERLKSIADLYRDLMIWQKEYRFWFDKYHEASIKAQQSNFTTTAEEKERLQGEVRSMINDYLVPKNQLISDLLKRYADKLDEHDFWVEDKLLDKFRSMLNYWTELGTTLQSLNWADPLKFRPEAMEEVKPIELKIMAAFADLKAAAKSYP
jgi:hypothetical protein